MIQNNDRHFCELQFSRGQQPTMPCDYASLGIHQNWVVEAELCDACRDLRYLRLGVGPRIPGEWNQFVDGPKLDALCHGMHVHTYPPKVICLGSFGRSAFGASLANSAYEHILQQNPTIRAEMFRIIPKSLLVGWPSR